MSKNSSFGIKNSLWKQDLEMDMMGYTKQGASQTASKFSPIEMMLTNVSGGIINIDTGGLGLVIILASTMDLLTLMMI